MQKEQINSQELLPMSQTLQMGKYRIDSYLSSGGFGNTYVVTNVEFEERMALKEFYIRGISERNDDRTTVSVSNTQNKGQFEAQKEKFKKEARRLRKLHNSHIVGVHDLFEENGTAYYVMDYVDGESLSERLKRTGKPLTEAETLAVLEQVLDALDAVHQQGIWHLDLKPGNIMMSSNGDVKVIDFGASKQMSSSDGYTTTTTAMCYTPGYAPTEQIDQKMELIGPWTDLYALGGTVYNLLTRNTPPTVSEMQEDDAFSYPPAVSSKMRYLVKWLMTPRRQARPQSVADVRAFLAEPFMEAGDASNDDEATVLGVAPKEQSVPKPEPVVEDATDSSDSDTVDNDSGNSTLKVVMGIAAIAVVVAILLAMGTCGRGGGSETNNSVASAEQGIGDSLKTVSNAYFDSALGVCSYTGTVDDAGKPDGLGEAKFTDGRLYKGHFNHGVMEGDDAYFRYENGDVFEGRFEANAFSYGKYTIKEDGSYFIGSFKKGQPDTGSWYDRNGNVMTD